MNVFEDLIEELKDEKLLEETVIGRNAVSAGMPARSATLQFGSAAEMVETVDRSAAEPTKIGEEVEETAIDAIDARKKRVMEEVSSLQMVEHVLSGIEREQIKRSPEAFDDLSVKKALHRFLQVSGDLDSEEFASAEFALMQEIEGWFSALAARDSDLSVANLRRFCENSRPVLSSQALIALARFYRNSPFSEPVRGKFDFVITRLFSRETGEDERKLLFGRLEAIGHLKTFYSNWSSLNLFPEDENADRIRSIIQTFDEFAAEALAADRFGELVSRDIFSRIRTFKEKTGEFFFVPEISAAAIECNVKIGNRFVELLRVEKKASSLETIEVKYGHTYDSLMSSAASKSLHLLEILREEPLEIIDPEPRDEETPQGAPGTAVVNFERAPVDEGSRSWKFTINKWLLATVVLVILLAGGVYTWSESVVQSQGAIESATTVEMSDPELRKHLRMALASSETLYGVAQPSWDARSEEEQRDLLRRALTMAQTLKMKRVNIVNYKGRTIGYATADKVELLGP